MKKKELGITVGEYTYSPMKGIQGHCCKAQVFDTDEISLCSIDSRYGETEATKKALFIADAFNTANKCGLLPSELLEQRAVLLDVLRHIELRLEWFNDYKNLAIVRRLLNENNRHH